MTPIKNRWSGQVGEPRDIRNGSTRISSPGLRLRERWEEVERSWKAPCPHPLASRSLSIVRTVRYGSICFHNRMRPATGAAAEIRHPFVDLRLLRYLLAVPVVPWCRAKVSASAGDAGKHFRQRCCAAPRSPATCDPLWQEFRSRGMAPLLPVPEMGRYVDFIRVPAQVDQDMMIFWINLRARALNYWLRNVEKPEIVELRA